MKIKNVRTSLIIFILSVIFLIAAYILILENGILKINLFFFLSLGFGLVGTVLFFLSFASMITLLVQSNRKLYFKDLNMFVARQLSSKINTNFLSISVVCIVLLLVIGIFSSGYSMQNVMSNSLKEYVSYDFSLVGDQTVCNGIYDSLPEEIKEMDLEHQEFRLYNSGNELHYNDLPLNYSSFPFEIKDNTLSLVLESDYNKAMEMQGNSPIKLSENQYALVTTIDNYKALAMQMIEKNISLPFDGKSFSPKKEIQKAQLSNAEYGVLTIVLPDECKKFLENISTDNTLYLNINCENQEQEKQLEEKLNIIGHGEDSPYYYFVSKAEVYTSSVTAKAILSFLAIYLGIVFMICCAAILGLQQLSEAADNKERYALLNKLGADKNMINKALFVQIFCYFMFPLLLAVIHSAVGLTAANDVIKNFGQIDVTSSIVVTSAFIIMIYGAYFGLTYIGSKNIINKN